MRDSENPIMQHFHLSSGSEGHTVFTGNAKGRPASQSKLPIMNESIPPKFFDCEPSRRIHPSVLQDTVEFDHVTLRSEMMPVLIKTSRNQKKKLGETSYFCPVTLKLHNVVWAGNPEIAARYKGKLYYFVSYDARNQFFENPELFLGDGKQALKVIPHL
ncbi:unnamed protein product [Protopolystoma xenopodis]|uniref:Uncharacterized protein n=1 Tax=Protopolystoma xenopodis TaxID=117903 RepID=A0A3S5C616_9PLAT|nr:unnamed protein product [Protopolystoma xenopodis]